MNMIVYVIVGSTWDFNWVEGVYASEEAAQAECTRLLNKKTDDYAVEEWTVR